ncbi:non-canonical purine NTP diphosphatase [Prolixibacter sp. SD074]|jgi:XTP/dITP diphosphohydrolase|uniref:non-canonical purine NTP diphosphatase n=1 Tax=Prolixibacter sp. SD074 TaxID=2652391 RepID=UPI0012740538|nr:non-canonical purine NTP diphosphatase [Prolixibacter sp. SD074]GET30525.1 non-canonical purine NTP pyrophosphatase [Prolixibacter sp. SD074]
MKKLVFATNNPHKLRELREILGEQFELLSLNDIGCTDDIPETGDTLEDNAAQKSFYIWDRYHINCFADDTGLEIDALNGEPGVYSARYAGGAKDARENVKKVLRLMNGKTTRTARFRTVISLIINGKEMQFEGVAEGEILADTRGEAGFGYDPVFLPEGKEKSFAEMEAGEKNEISHRGRAVAKLVDYLKKS